MSVSAFANAVAAPTPNAQDLCESGDIGMRLQSMWKEGRGFKGAFELKPWSLAPGDEMILSGARTRKGFYLTFPTAGLSFADANGSWHPLLKWGSTVDGKFR